MLDTVGLILCFLLVAGGASLSEAAVQHMMQPRVPADKLAEARALTSPLPSSPEIVEQGKANGNFKGACFNWQGKDGYW